MAGDKDKKKKRSSKKGSKDRAKSRAKPLDAEAFDRAATTLNDATAKLMRAAERHALGDVNHDGAPPDDRSEAAARRWIEGCEERRLAAVAFDLVIAADDDTVLGEFGLSRLDRSRRGSLDGGHEPHARLVRARPRVPQRARHLPHERCVFQQVSLRRVGVRIAEPKVQDIDGRLDG